MYCLRPDRSAFVRFNVELFEQLRPRDPDFEFFAAGKCDRQQELIAAIIVGTLTVDLHFAGDHGTFAIGADGEVIIELAQCALGLGRLVACAPSEVSFICSRPWHPLRHLSSPIAEGLQLLARRRQCPVLWLVDPLDEVPGADRVTARGRALLEPHGRLRTGPTAAF